MTRAIIEDGYTRTSFLNAVEGIYPAVKFVWRPATLEQRSQYVDYIGTNSNSHTEAKRTMECLAKHLDKLEDCKSIDITPMNLLKLHPLLGRRLTQIIIWGDLAPDLDKDSPDFKASLANTSLDEFLAKNSNRDSES